MNVGQHFLIFSQLQNINDKLENPPKGLTELEYLLSWAAKKRAELTELMADTEKGLGSMVAASIFSICLRLSYMLFANLFTAMKALSGTLSVTGVFRTSVRVILKIIILLQLAHSGQLLADEVKAKILY